jgi:anthranilate phosphoribosyltransferase
VLHAALALVAAGVADEVSGGLELAVSVIDDGRAAARVDALARFSSEAEG